MAFITDILNTIKNARKGKDMRQAIYDGIRQCYNDATGHPESVAAAVKKIGEVSANLSKETADRKAEVNTERKRIDNLIKELPATAGEYQQSKLVLHSYDNAVVKCTTTSGNYTNVPAFTTDQGGPLSSLYTKKSNYQIAVNKSGLYLFELRIHVNSLIANKRVELAPFVNDTRIAALASSYNTAGNFTLTQVAALPLWLSANDTVDFRIAPIEAVEVSLQLGDVLVYAIDWEDKFKIPDYTGYAAETKDIRTGADGTVYGTAGEAVRRQIGNITEDLVRTKDFFLIKTEANVLSSNKFDNVFDEVGKYEVSSGEQADAYTLHRSSKFYDIGDFNGKISVGFSGHDSSDEVKCYIYLYTKNKQYVNYIFVQNVPKEKSINEFATFYNGESLSTASIKYFRICKTADADMQVYVSTIKPLTVDDMDFSYDFGEKIISCGAVDRMRFLINRSNMFCGNIEKHIINGYLNALDGSIEPDNKITSQVTDFIKVIPNEILFYSGKGSTSAANVCFYNEEFDFISSVNLLNYGTFEINVPSQAIYARFASRSNEDGEIAELIVNVKSKSMYKNNLTGKKWYACGDSFTEGAYIFDDLKLADRWLEDGKYAGKLKSYPYYIGNRTNCDVYNIALSGSTLAYVSSEPKNYSFSSDYGTEEPPYNNYKSVPIDADYITLWFGINDNGYNVPIGNDNDATNTTFKGAYNIVLKHFIENCKKAKIGIIVSNNMPQAYVDATIKMADRWGIKYLDLNSDEVPLMQATLRNVCDEAKANAINKFALSKLNMHPNYYAHEFESKFIEHWLLSL